MTKIPFCIPTLSTLYLRWILTYFLSVRESGPNFLTSLYHKRPFNWKKSIYVEDSFCLSSIPNPLNFSAILFRADSWNCDIKVMRKVRPISYFVTIAHDTAKFEKLVFYWWYSDSLYFGICVFKDGFVCSDYCLLWYFSFWSANLIQLLIDNWLWFNLENIPYG